MGEQAPPPSRLADVGEDAAVTALLARYRPVTAPGWLGPGDDAAVLPAAAVGARLAISTDMVVQGADFRFDWSTGFQVGHRLAAQTLADVAAMGARPVALLVSFAAPATLPVSWAAEVASGIDAECGRAGALVVGGDVSGAAEVVVTGTGLGALDGPPVRRGGARPGDVVALAGNTGAAAAGLALLSAGMPRTAPPVTALIEAHLAPRPPYEAGPVAAAAGATSLIDISDGLARDAGRVAAASGVLLALDGAALRPSEDLRAAAELLGEPDAAQEWVLGGGEDHALLATFPADAAIPPSYRRIGRVLASSGGTTASTDRVLVDGRPWTGSAGWTHFRRPDDRPRSGA